MAKITAPSKEFTGKRGSVAFIDGVGETDDPAMLAYFRRHGYKVEGAEQAEKPAKRAAAKKTAAKKAPAKKTAEKPPVDAEPDEDTADSTNEDGDSESSSD